MGLGVLQGCTSQSLFSESKFYNTRLPPSARIICSRSTAPRSYSTACAVDARRDGDTRRATLAQGMDARHGRDADAKQAADHMR